MSIANSIIEYANVPYTDKILENAARLHIPVQGELEITTVCNFKCRHCYVTNAGSNCGQHMPLQAACDIIDQFSSAGCVWLLITGGEPLSHPDFFSLWQHAWDRGLRLSLFTNGSLLNKETLDFLCMYPPDSLEISLYSLKENVFRDFTGSQSGFQNLMSTLTLLKDVTFKVFLKTPILTLNVEEIPALESFAKDNGFGFRMDAVIHPSLSGNRTPLSFRVPASHAAELTMRDPEIRKQVCQSFHTMTVPFNDSDFILPCSAGIYSFHIGADLSMNACSILRNNLGNMSSETFLQTWKSLVTFRGKPKTTENGKCESCNLKSICVMCPAIPNLFKENEDFVDEYVCEYTKCVANRAGLLQEKLIRNAPTNKDRS